MGRVKAKRTSVNSEQEMVEGLARAVHPTPPVKRMGKSRAASSVLINTTRCCVLTLIHLSKLTCCQLPIPSGLNWEGADGARGEGEDGSCGTTHSVCEGKEEEIDLDCLA